MGGDGEHRTGSVAHDALRRAAQQQMFYARVAVGRDDNQVSLVLAGLDGDFVEGFAQADEVGDLLAISCLSLCELRQFLARPCDHFRITLG